MPGKQHQRPQHELDAELERVVELTTRGYTEGEIASELSISRSMVHYWKDRARQIWKENIAEQVDTMAGQQLAELRAIKQEAWSEWRRSRLVRKKTSKKNVDSTKNNRTENVEVEEGRLGDPNYLNVILGALQREAKLLGIDAPDKFEVDLKLTPEERAKELELLFLEYERVGGDLAGLIEGPQNAIPDATGNHGAQDGDLERQHLPVRGGEAGDQDVGQTGGIILPV